MLITVSDPNKLLTPNSAPARQARQRLTQPQVNRARTERGLALPQVFPSEDIVVDDQAVTEPRAGLVLA
jgi:hypothetical protein